MLAVCNSSHHIYVVQYSALNTRTRKVHLIHPWTLRDWWRQEETIVEKHSHIVRSNEQIVMGYGPSQMLWVEHVREQGP